MARRATIRDVAEKAGVSKSTVSLVLQGSPAVRAETRQAVEQAIEALDYVRNRAAAALRGAHSGRVGIVVNDLRTPFVTDFVAAAQQALAERGLAALVATAGEDPSAEQRAVRLALEQDVAGLLIAPCHGSGAKVFDTLLAAKLPVIQVLRQGDARLEQLPFHSLDYAIGSHLAAQHLLDQGLRRIAFVGGHAGHQIARERASGYRDVLQVHGARPVTFHGGATRAFGREAMALIAEKHVDMQAALCINDEVALGMSEMAARLGGSIGRDFYLVGFDDIPECVQADPPLSSVRCDVAGFARRSVEHLTRWIDAGTRPPDLLRQPVQLQVRASSTVAEAPARRVGIA
jgi:LacI family transcriptional regulator